jgi:RNase P subunit RPR2
MSRIRQMLRYAAAKSRCEICHTTRFSMAAETVTLEGKEYAVVTCQRCGRMALHDVEVLEDRSAGAPFDTA